MIEKVKASELVLDYNLYPRHQINESNVTALKLAMESGASIPPVIADRATKRLADGFHRTTAALKLDPNALIDVEFRDYADEGALFTDAVALNAGHGQRLSPYDVSRCAALAERFSISMDDLAAALHMRPERLTTLVARKTAISTSGPIPIKNTLRHLAGHNLNKRQVEGNKQALGSSQVFLVNQVINLLENDLLDSGNEQVMERLAHLAGLLAKKRFKKAS